MFGLSDVKVEGQHQYTGCGRPKETSTLSVRITDVSCTCELEILDSCYLSVTDGKCVLGEAASMVDRALERAFSVMVDGETAVVNIIMPKCYVDENFEVSLTCKACLKIIESGKSVFDYGVGEKLNLATKYKNMGVEIHKQGTTLKHLSSYLFFCQAIKWLALIEPGESEKQTSDIKSVKMQCYNNIGLYHLNRKNYSLAVTATTKVLKVESTNVKARYRRAVANMELQNYDEAEEDLKIAVAADPNNGPIKKQQEELRKRQKLVSEKYAVAMRKFLS